MTIFPTTSVPLTISGLALWLDASKTPLGAVASWTDLSGNKTSPIQATVLQQPISTANQSDNLNALVFSGASNLAAASYNSFLASALQSNYTIFAVAKSTSSSSQRIMTQGVGVSLRGYLMYNGDGTIRFGNSSTSTVSPVSVAATYGNFNIISAYLSGTTQSIQINNGTAVTNTSGGASATATNLNIGAALNAASVLLVGSIGEFLIYKNALSATDITTINRYLSNKWGIAI